MNHIAAALLISLAGKTVDKKSLEEVLAAAGSKPVPSVVEMILGAIKNKKPEQIVKEGLSKLASVTGVSASSTVAAPTEEKKDAKKDDKKDAKKDDKKKEAPKKKEVEPEDDDDAGFGGLF